MWSHPLIGRISARRGTSRNTDIDVSGRHPGNSFPAFVWLIGKVTQCWQKSLLWLYPLCDAIRFAVDIVHNLMTGWEEIKTVIKLLSRWSRGNRWFDFNFFSEISTNKFDHRSGLRNKLEKSRMRPHSSQSPTIEKYRRPIFLIMAVVYILLKIASTFFWVNGFLLFGPNLGKIIL